MKEYQIQIPIVKPRKTKGYLVLSRIIAYSMPIAIISLLLSIYFDKNIYFLLISGAFILLNFIAAIIIGVRSLGFVEEFERVGIMVLSESYIKIKMGKVITNHPLNDIDHIIVKLTETSEDPTESRYEFLRNKEGIHNEIEIVKKNGNRIFNQVYIENHVIMRVINKVISTWPREKLLRMRT